MSSTATWEWSGDALAVGHSSTNGSTSSRIFTLSNSKGTYIPEGSTITEVDVTMVGSYAGTGSKSNFTAKCLRISDTKDFSTNTFVVKKTSSATSIASFLNYSWSASDQVYNLTLNGSGSTKITNDIDIIYCDFQANYYNSNNSGVTAQIKSVSIEVTWSPPSSGTTQTSLTMSNISLSPSTVKGNDKVQLTYSINTGTLTSKTLTLNGSAVSLDSSNQFQAPSGASNASTTYTYSVTFTGSNNSIITQSLYLTVDNRTISPPSNIYVGTNNSTTSTTLNVGTSANNSSNTVYLRWSQCAATSETISSYQWSIDDSSWTTINGTLSNSYYYATINISQLSLSNTNSTRQLYMRVLGSGGSTSSTSSNYATINLIANPTFDFSVNDSSNSSIDIDKDVTAIISNIVATGTYSSKIVYGTNTISSTSGTISVSNLVADSPTDVVATVSISANIGTSSTSKTITVTRIASLGTIDTITYYDANATTKTTALTDGSIIKGTNRAYDNLTISWKNLQTTDDITYQLQYRIGSTGNFSTLDSASFTYALSADQTIASSSISVPSSWRGYSVYFMLTAQRNKSQGSSSIFSIDILETPSITNVVFNQAADTDRTVNISFERNSIGSDYYGYIIYLNQTTASDYTENFTLGSGTLTSASELKITMKSTDLSVSKIINNYKSSIDLYNGLYNDITHGNVQPSGYVTIYLYNEQYVNCNKTIAQPITYKYYGTINSPGTFQSSIAKYNPGINCTITQTSLPTVNELISDSEELSYTYYISSNNLSSTQLNFTTNSNGTITATFNPNIGSTLSQQMTVTYTITTIATYADKKTTIQKTSNLSITFYRWWKDQINVDASFNTSGGKIASIKYNIKLPTKMFSSNQYNLDSYQYTITAKYADTNNPYSSGGLTSIYNKRLTTPYTITGQIDLSTIEQENRQTNVQLIVNFKVTNTSGGILTLDDTTITLRASSIPLALRKTRVGINVAPTFDGETDSTTGACTIFNITGNNTSPILQLQQDAFEIPFIRLTQAQNYSVDITTYGGSDTAHSLAFVYTNSNISYTYYLSAPLSNATSSMTYNLLHDQSSLNATKIIGTLGISHGGTGASTGSQAFINLISAYNSSLSDLSSTTKASIQSYLRSAIGTVPATMVTNAKSTWNIPTVSYADSLPTSGTVGDICLVKKG